MFLFFFLLLLSLPPPPLSLFLFVSMKTVGEKYGKTVHREMEDDYATNTTELPTARETPSISPNYKNELSAGLCRSDLAGQF